VGKLKKTKGKQPKTKNIILSNNEKSKTKKTRNQILKTRIKSLKICKN